MGFIAEVHLSHDDLPLVPTIERRSGTTLRYEYGTTHDERRLQFVSAFGDDYPALEAAMASDPTVSEPTRIATFDNRAIYRVVVDTDLEIVPARCADRGLFVFTITSDDGGWVARVHLPDRDALSAFRTHCRDRGISFRVTQLYDSSVSDDQTYFLTDRQHEILTMAYYAGYFQVPRNATQDDLADRLDVSDSAVSQRLRRAIAELIAATLENDRLPAKRR
ncbi:helix-turn-helix domain-containing protein [Natrinema sp. 1APR25-10V2]|uniref:helix-turn-helix domain-containing protein n=1 Tax=Natrinema sp. 1APR25-10V2 TaxID=2951081 RepID=UPI002875AAB4|nr:helix-turn-helix domain-containing protein [Natrinema sp. 1APR25-10V2]MDS0477594.1 helix-turn-helix domain-containing protein [Natrinema sp. 1APR25-10V2]